MGVSIIYLSPIFYSQSNHGYDTANYRVIDPYKGSNQDFNELAKEVHKRGMYLILDGVFNHTGNDSIYFNEYGTFDTVGAYQSVDSPYYEFYRIVDGNPTFWWGHTNEPVCDGDSPKWQDYIYGDDGIMPYWIEQGADGYRYDVADELTDKFLEGGRDSVYKKKKDAYFCGEVWKNPMRMGRGYISSGKCLDSVMNYPLSDALISYFKECDINKLKDICYQILVEYPKDTILSLMNFSSTHDISRIINILGFDDKFKDNNCNREWIWDLKDNDLRMKHHKLSKEQYEKGKIMTQAYLFALTFFPGNLSIFYGDEVCAQGLGNLANRCPFPWDNMDKQMLQFVRKTVGKTRMKYTFLETAGTEIVRIDENHFVFERYSENGRKSMLIIVSRRDEETLVSVPRKYRNSKVIAALRGERKKLGPYGAIALKRR